MKIIGITGLAGSGKNTVGGMLAGILLDRGYMVALDGFAVGVKRQARNRGWNGLKDEAGRRLLQDIGLERRETEHAGYWIEKLARRMPPADFHIICDVRFQNEAEWILAKGGALWAVSGRGGIVGEAGRHESERNVKELADMASVLIVNNGTLEGLRESIEALVDKGKQESDPASLQELRRGRGGG